MTKGTIIPLVMGLAIGGLAIKLGLNTIQKAKASARVEIVPVVVAVDDIPATAKIDQTMLKTVQTPVTPLLGRDSYREVKEVVGRVPVTTIPRGAVVREELLAPEGTPAGLTVRIPKGYRAVSLKINEVSGVAYQIRPGSFVDVIAVMKSGRRREMVSRIILQRVEVVAVGRMLSTGTDPGGKSRAAKSVTLLVRDSDVPTLHLAQTNGKVTLAMRGPSDTLEADPGQASEGELLGLIKPDPPAEQKPVQVPSRSVSMQPAQPRYTVTVVDGSGRPATVTFDGANSTRQLSRKGHRGGAAGRPALTRQDGDDEKDDDDDASSSRPRGPTPG